MQSMPKLLIIADDFTGAMDTGVQLAQFDIEALVVTHWEPEANILADSQVLSLNAGTRHLSPQQAKKVYESILSAYQGVPYLYLKTDSALRGNLSAGFSALLEESQEPVFFIPAYPAVNRWTKDGYHYINGELLEHSVFSKDPRTPAVESYIPSLLAKDFPVATKLLPADFSETEFSTNTAYIVDSKTEEEIVVIGNKLKAIGFPRKTAGCAGFASVFPKVLSFETKALASLPENNSPTLFLSGSANAITFAQLQKAEEQGYKIIIIPPALKARGSEKEAKRFVDFCKEIIKILTAGQSVIVATAQSEQEVIGEKNISPEIFQQRLEEIFAETAKEIKNNFPLRNLAIFGGDTALAVLSAFEIQSLLLLKEVQPGVPLSLTKGEPSFGLVTKSGGLGGVDVVKKIDYALQGRSLLC